MDEIFLALADRTRRDLLFRLATLPPAESVALDELVSDRDRPAQARVQLLHVHLPKLEDLGLVAWERDRDEVRRGPDFHEVRPVLDLLDDNRSVLPGDLV